MSTKIEWTDDTWNPVTGCSHISAGCKNCYAETFTNRFKGVPGHHFENGFKVTLRPERLDQPLRWKRGRKIFVNSMSDLFHEDVPFEYIAAVFGVMGWASHHTFQVLTKRPERMLAFFEYMRTYDFEAGAHHGADGEGRAMWEALCGQYGRHISDHLIGDEGQRIRLRDEWPLPNVWLGVSVENQAAANTRIPLLLQAPAVVRFLSCEPLLGPVELDNVEYAEGEFMNMLSLEEWADAPDSEEVQSSPWGANLIDWVIAGGESGHGARPMHPDWARSLRDQCAAADVPFFFKQWGEYAFTVPAEFADAPTIYVNKDGVLATEQQAIEAGGTWKGGMRIGKKRAGRLLDGVEHNEFPRGAQ